MALARVVGGYAQNLVVPAGLVGHPEHADGSATDQAAGEGGLVDQHQRVERITIQAESVLDEPIVTWVPRGREQPSIQPDPPGLVVHLVLVPASGRNLDGDVELHGWHLRAVLHVRSAPGHPGEPHGTVSRTVIESLSPPGARYVASRVEPLGDQRVHGLPRSVDQRRRFHRRRLSEGSRGAALTDGHLITARTHTCSGATDPRTTGPHHGRGRGCRREPRAG